jgi:hypothetical protein
MNAESRATLGTVGVPEIVTGRPSVAPNTGAGLNSKLLRGFDPVTATIPTPEWVRLPKPGARCTYSGLARTTLLELIERGEFRAITLRQPGATRGIRLFHLPGLFAWLARLDAEQNGAEANAQREGSV